jgi:hypothetical protein
MRPALQRLLSRPSSLDLLRCLVGTPAPLSAAPTSRTRKPLYKTKNATRAYAGTAVAASEKEVCEPAEKDQSEKLPEARKNPGALKIVRTSRKLYTAPTETLDGKEFLSSGYYGPWKKPTMWRTQDEIDFQSNLAAPEHPFRQRLLDQPAHRKDLQLFARLLDHRERRYGMDGIRMYWEAVKERRIRLPTRDYRETKNVGLTAEKLWTSFLHLGFYNNKVLEELCDYADKLLEKTGRRWPRLYSTIVQHFLVIGRGKEAVAWHNRLFERHPPSAHGFAELCHQTVHHRGDLKALKEIYEKNEHRNAYGKIVPTLAWQEDFKSAMKWHFILINKGDVPTKPQHAQSLSRFLAIYDRQNAVRVTKSLVAAGARFDVPTTLNDNVKISREIMNLVHGKTFKIPVKAYNDEYGARWFATSWVPLELAMHSIHALGIQEIGPLSLQALCVRKEYDGSEPTPYAILRRIEKIQDIGISIGNSVFSRAVKHFAQNRMFNYLKDLLKSDQHPETLEDFRHLEDLLAHFARIRDWEQYRRILAIRTVSSRAPATEAQNVWLKTNIANHNFPAALDVLAKMQVNGTIVKTGTIAFIVRNILVRRQQSRRPVPLNGGAGDIDMAINILGVIMDAGNLVPAAYWREIIRRLGMLGRQRDLHELCMFLARRYGPGDKSYLQHVGVRKANFYRVPAQIDTSHPLHPLKILFPVSLQRAIVEWGFINALQRRHPRLEESKELVPNDDINRQVTAGITLLRDLSRQGVNIDSRTMKKAVFDRLITYYGPGWSNRRKNRVARIHAPEFELMMRQIEQAIGQKTFGSDLKVMIVSRGMSRLLRRDKIERKRRLKQ